MQAQHLCFESRLYRTLHNPVMSPRRYQQIAPRAGLELPVPPNYPRKGEPKVSEALASTLGVKREVPGVDRIGRVDREKVLAALDPTPPATSALGGKTEPPPFTFMVTRSAYGSVARQGGPKVPSDERIGSLLYN